jgi:hypothetical protein
VASCSGGLILHRDGTFAGCTNDPDCLGLDVRHEGDPKVCYEWNGGCNYCGIHLDIGS